MKRALRWIAWNAPFAVLAWLAVNGNVNAGRVVGAWSWLATILLFLAMWRDETRRLAQAKGRSVPKWIGHVLEFSLAAMLFWFGWTTLGVHALIRLIAEEVIFDLKPKEESP